MPAKSLRALADNLDEIDRLMRLHADAGGDGPGRKHRLEVLNKAAIVLLTAFWEAYVEDTVTEALTFIVDNTDDPTQLPIYLQKRVASDIKKAVHDLEPWKLAGDGWKAFLMARMVRLTEERNFNFNTAKTNPSRHPVQGCPRH